MLKGGNIFPLLSPRQTLQGEHISLSPLRKEEETEAQSGQTTCQALTGNPRMNLTLALPGVRLNPVFSPVRPAAPWPCNQSVCADWVSVTLDAENTALPRPCHVNSHRA